MQSSPPVFLGYLVKKVVARLVGLQDSRVKRICSVSCCISPEPEKKFELWRFNSAGLYDSEELALSTVPPEDSAAWTIFALELYPLEFVDGRANYVPVGELLGTDELKLPSGPAPGYRLLGYDAVDGTRSRAGNDNAAGATFAYRCSPLSCNGESLKYQVTPDCLLPNEAEALQAALAFSREEPEPGPYYVFKVYGKEPVVVHAMV